MAIMQSAGRRLRSEGGAIVIQVAVALLFLIAFSALTIDYGVLWVGRAQAQNAADAGALAAAVSMSVGNFSLTDRSDTGTVKSSAVAAARSNPIWTGQPAVTLADVTFPTANCVDVATGNALNTALLSPCVRVSLFRNLPTYFAQLFQVNAQRVQATATAQATAANSTRCASPWAIPDRWLRPGFVFPPGPPQPGFTPATDIYSPPNSTTPVGKNYQYRFINQADHSQLSEDYGRPTTLSPATLATRIYPGQFVPVAYAGTPFVPSILGCSGVLTSIGGTLTMNASATLAQSTAAATILVNRDPAAFFDPAAKVIRNSCASSNPPCAAISPRVVVLPVFNVSDYENDRGKGIATLHVVNFVGFFIQTVGPNITGVLVAHPGLVTVGQPSVTHDSAFLRQALLVR